MLRLVLAGLISLVVAALLGLGVWQLQRRIEKHALIARVEARVTAPASAPPDRSRWPAISGPSDEYRHVRLSGHFLNDKETLTQAVTDAGAGFWVLTPLVTPEGYTVLINRGFVPDDKRAAATRLQGQLDGDVTVTGLLRMTEPRGGFLRSNDPAANRWYSRDVAAIAAARGLGETAPYFVDADATPNPGGLPIGGLTVIRFPDNHLVYALTWFALGLGLAGAAIYNRRL
jgi:surfeit locus 1 family protein